jgi:polysaccharide pyruvyl transferase WcaK-like protein
MKEQERVMDGNTTAHCADRPFRVVVQNGEYWLCNKGDLAMLDVTVGRLREHWPTARIGVLTSAPHLLRAFHPTAEPISDRGRGEWPSTGPATRLAQRFGPEIVGPPSMAWLRARDAPVTFARRAGGVLRRRTGRPAADPRASTGATDAVPAALRTASLVMAMGGGYFTDVDPDQAHRTLTLLEHAIDRGIPTAMVGQGLGPVDDPALLARAARILPRVDVIALREGLRGPDLLSGLGVPSDRVTVTGDDAIELAYAVRTAAPGRDVGVCLRVAEYSPVAGRTKDSVGRAVRDFAGRVGAGLVPLIISEYLSEDRRSTLPLVEGFANTVPPLGRQVTPHEVARRVSRCRVLVTGAYHLGVFALSQGIPVVGLSSSRYYDDKLRGLDAMFGGDGLRLVRLDEPDLDGRLDIAIREAWEAAPGLRQPRRDRAEAQIAASSAAFARIFDLVERAQLRA